MLFADIQGSMQLAIQLDPERWHELLERYFVILTDAVHRFAAPQRSPRAESYGEAFVAFPRAKPHLSLLAQRPSLKLLLSARPREVRR